MSIVGQAKPWEFRWRIVIMLASLPLAAVLFSGTGMSPGRWDAPLTDTLQRVSAAIVASLGLVLRVWGTTALSAKRMLRLQARGETLVESGPFAVVRNPLYLGTILVIVGWSILYGWLPAVLFMVFHAVRFHRIVIFEESLIQAEWGSRFEDYCARVPRWCPRRTRIREAGWPHISIAAALSNGPFVAMTIALIAISWTAKTWIFFPSMIIGMLVSGVFLVIHRLRQRGSAEDSA